MVIISYMSQICSLFMPDNSLFNTFYLQGNSYDTNEGIILTNEETLISRSLSEPFRVKDSAAFLARSFVSLRIFL